MEMSLLPPYLKDLHFPVVFRDGLNRAGWQLNKLSFEAISDVFNGPYYTFRLGRRDRKDIVWQSKVIVLHNSPLTKIMKLKQIS